MRAIRLLVAIAVLVLLGLRLLIGAIPAGPDVAHPPALDLLVEETADGLADGGLGGDLGPFHLGRPRLTAFRCSADGRTVQLLFAWPVTNAPLYAAIGVKTGGAYSVEYDAAYTQEEPAAPPDAGDCANVAVP